MDYIEENFNRRMNEENEKLRLAHLKIDTCLKHITFNNFVEKMYIINGFEKMRKSDVNIDKKYALKNTVIKLLRNQKADHTITSSTVEKEIEGKYNGDSVEKHRISYEISSDSLKTLISAIEDYYNSLMNMKRLKEDFEKRKLEAQQKEKERKQELEKEKEEERKREIERERSVSEYTPTYSYSSSKVETSKPRAFTSTNDEEIKDEIIKKIESKINGEGYSTRFTIEEEREIKRLYPELNSLDIHYSSIDTLEKGINVEKMSSKKSLNASDMMKLTSDVYDIMVKYLLAGSNANLGNSLFNKFKISDSLKKYEKMYNKWMKSYNELSPAEKQAISETISNNRLYTSKFGNSILSTEELTTVINNKVKYQIVDERNLNFRCNQDDFVSKIKHATKYMDIKDIKQLYAMMHEEYFKYGAYGRTPEEQAEEARALAELGANLQDKFAHVMLDKLETYSPSGVSQEMTDEEKQEYYDKRCTKISAVIRSVFNETPLKEEYLNTGSERELTSIADNLVKDYEAKKEAKSQVYGLSKLSKTIAKISGKWKKYVNLIEKEELSAAERNELTSMFNGR